jgi:hypothetical protein
MSNINCINNIRESNNNDPGKNEIHSTSLVKKIGLEIIARLLRKYNSIYKFYKHFMLDKLENEISNNIKTIQRYYRKYLLKITFKKNLIKRKFYENLTYNIIILQKHIRRHIIYHNYKSIFKGKTSNYYLINGDINNSIKERLSKLRLIRYDHENGEDIMKYYDFDYIKSLDKHILFIPKADIKKENTLVNFVADGKIIINENTPVYKYGNKNYYNVLNLSQLSEKDVKQISLDRINLRENVFNFGKLSDLKNCNIMYCSNPLKKIYNEDFCSKRNKSSLNVKLLKNFNPILKVTSKNVLHSSKSSHKRVSFLFE